jgi:hypothetical protein
MITASEPALWCRNFPPDARSAAPLGWAAQRTPCAMVTPTISTHRNIFDTPFVFSGSRHRKNPLMRSLVVAMTVMTLVPAAPAAGPAPVQLQVQAGVDVRSGGSRSSAPVIDSDGRGERARDRANCRTVKLTEWRNGAKVSRRERRCER